MREKKGSHGREENAGGNRRSVREMRKECKKEREKESSIKAEWKLN